MKRSPRAAGSPHRAGQPALTEHAEVPDERLDPRR